MPRRHRRRAKPEWTGRDVITVAALPGRGLYVRHLGHPEGVDGVHRPTVRLPGARPKPPAVFHADWLAHELDAFDLVHVHGLPQQLTGADVEHALDTIRRAGRPLVITAYHLTDPWGTGEEHFEAQFAPLVRAADAVLTLTPRAAEQLRSRYGVEADVLPHPHVVDFVRMRRPRPTRREPFVVGAHLGSLRAAVEPVHFVESLAEAAAQVPGTQLVVHLHDHLADRGSVRYAPDLIAAVTAATEAVGGRVRLHRPMTDPQLWDYLFELDASVLPPMHGSHSIWPEACYDLGTRLVLPASSLAAGQQPCFGYATEGGTVDVGSLTEALAAARAEETPPRADPAERWKQRETTSEFLRDLYERLVPAKGYKPVPVHAEG